MVEFQRNPTSGRWILVEINARFRARSRLASPTVWTSRQYPHPPRTQPLEVIDPYGDAASGFRACYQRIRSAVQWLRG